LQGSENGRVVTIDPMYVRGYLKGSENGRVATIDPMYVRGYLKGSENGRVATIYPMYVRGYLKGSENGRVATIDPSCDSCDKPVNRMFCFIYSVYFSLCMIMVTEYSIWVMTVLLYFVKVTGKYIFE
jgi:hypothetical protein